MVANSKVYVNIKVTKYNRDLASLVTRAVFSRQCNVASLALSNDEITTSLMP